MTKSERAVRALYCIVENINFWGGLYMAYKGEYAIASAAFGIAIYFLLARKL